MSFSSKNSAQKLGEFHTVFGWAYAYRGHYLNGTIAVQLETERGDLIATLSVYVPLDDIVRTLASNEFVVMDWDENTRLIELALASGLFEDTGRLVDLSADGRSAPIWRIRTPARQQHNPYFVGFSTLEALLQTHERTVPLYATVVRERRPTSDVRVASRYTYVVVSDVQHGTCRY